MPETKWWHGNAETEEARWNAVAPLIDILEMNHTTMKEVLEHLTVLANLNGWEIVRYPTSVAFVYGEHKWECIIICPMYDYIKLYDYHTQYFTITM